MILDSQGIARRIWTMPVNKKENYYATFKLDRAANLFDFCYSREFECVHKSRVKKMIEILKNQVF